MVTIKKIAEMAGVSRGTVDRVLNKRGNVNPETAKKIELVAEQLGYTPNLAGKALAVRKKPPVIGIVLSSEGNPFFDDVIQSINRALDDLSDYGVTHIMRTMKGYDAERQLELIGSIEQSINILILTPISDPRIAEKIDALYSAGIITITLNTDIAHTKRICYIGSDYFRGGMMACGMMGLLTGGKANLGVVMGSFKVLGHSTRIAGFREVMKARYPGMTAVDFIETEDDDFVAYDRTVRLLSEHPEIDALFIVAAGVYGVCRAVKSLALPRPLTIVSFDDIPATKQMMAEGVIRATICQQPQEQGYQAVRIAFDAFIGGKLPVGGMHIVANEIKIYESIFGSEVNAQ